MCILDIPFEAFRTAHHNVLGISWNAVLTMSVPSQAPKMRKDCRTKASEDPLSYFLKCNSSINLDIMQRCDPNHFRS